MPEFVIPDLDETVLARLKDRAAAQGITPQAEARRILLQAVQSTDASGWDNARAIHDRLAASGRQFSDSTDMVRADRER